MKCKGTFMMLLLIVLCGPRLQAQESHTSNPASVSTSDSIKVAKHSPTTAMLCSIIPGGGQIYNKKYWKLPIVYGCIGASSYFIYNFYSKMDLCRNEYINRRDGKNELLNPDFSEFDDENILQMKNDYLRNMEIAIGVTAVLYTLNIIDAMVDAHLYYFDVSDELSFRWSPAMMPSLASHRPAYGLTLQLRW